MSSVVLKKFSILMEHSIISFVHINFFCLYSYKHIVYTLELGCQLLLLLPEKPGVINQCKAAITNHEGCQCI